MCGTAGYGTELAFPPFDLGYFEKNRARARQRTVTERERVRTEIFDARIRLKLSRLSFGNLNGAMC